MDETILSWEWAKAMIRQFGTDEQKRRYLPELEESK
jgi:alkylation response protein AidB-like acyl-CoA dehydrogenase